MPEDEKPIQIKRSRQTVSYEESRTVDGSTLLTLKDLEWIGGDAFSVKAPDPEEEGYCGGCVVITVYRSREETDEEMQTRIAREEHYVSDYISRQRVLNFRFYNDPLLGQ